MSIFDRTRMKKFGRVPSWAVGTSIILVLLLLSTLAVRMPWPCIIENAELGSLAEWLGAVGTVGAVIVALFTPLFARRREWRRRPILDVTLRLNPPDCHKTIMEARNSSGQVIHHDCYYYRLWVENEGSTTAENVQVFVSSIKQLKDGEYKGLNSFLPMSLKWSYRGGKVFSEGISSKMGQHCDLFHMIRTFGKPIFANLDVEIPPLNRSHQLAPGNYQIYFKIAGSNCDPIEKVLTFCFNGKWYASEDEMFKEGVAILAFTNA